MSIDWDDLNANAAADCALRLMAGDHYDYTSAVAAAAKMYSTPVSSVVRATRELAAGRGITINRSQP